MNATRRQFLIGGLEVTLAVPLASRFGTRLLSGAGGGDERVLVVLQLTGGNDGLNMVVPHRQDAYYRARPTLGLARGALHALDDDHGLHPALGGLSALYNEGQLAVVHGVGLPVPDRSHFRSMEVWHTADPDNPPGETGWLGRLADQLVERDASALAGLHVGVGDLPLAFRGISYFTPTVRDPAGFRARDLGPDFGRARDMLLDGPGGGDVAFLREAARTTYDAAERMSALADGDGGVEYPNTELARRLRLVGRLVAGGFGARIFHVALEGFDTHARQAPVHDGLMRELNGALAAFQLDLAQHGAEERVLTLVHSEFGRRVKENGSSGTDHGAGAPVFLVGGAVRGGQHGTPPDLDRLVEGDVPPTTDFRGIYTMLEREWMGLRASTGVAAEDWLRT